MKTNYQKELETIIENNQKDGKVPTILLHTCCAPCSSYCIESLSNFFRITVFYYNPNIAPEEEYRHRKEEQIRFLKEIKTKYPVSFLDCDYDNANYCRQIYGLEGEREGGKRCLICYRLRLEKTAQTAQIHHFDYFGTSLTVSPYKNSQVLNELGKELEEKYSVSYLYSDFKKKNGYLRSIELSRQYRLYRQNYCGCIYSKKEA